MPLHAAAFYASDALFRDAPPLRHIFHIFAAAAALRYAYMLQRCLPCTPCHGCCCRDAADAALLPLPAITLICRHATLPCMPRAADAAVTRADMMLLLPRRATIFSRHFRHAIRDAMPRFML